MSILKNKKKTKEQLGQGMNLWLLFRGSASQAYVKLCNKPAEHIHTWIQPNAGIKTDDSSINNPISQGNFIS